MKRKPFRVACDASLARVATSLFFMLSSLWVCAQPDPNFHIYISIGQSNMEGQGTIESADVEGLNPRFLTMAAVDFSQRNRARGEWYPALPPICREDLVTVNPVNRGLGPTDYFGRTMADNTPEEVRIGVICVAVGAAKIEGFFRDISVAQDYYNHQCKEYVREKYAMYDYYGYGHILSLARQAQKSGVIRGILLHQGESNYGQTDWPDKVKEVYENLLSDLGLEAEKVPLLVGEVTENGPSASMNSIIRTIPKHIPTAYVISSAGAPEKPNDKIHFNSEGYREMGRRYAAKMLELEGYANKCQPELSIAQDYLKYSTASSIVRLALQNAVKQAEEGNSSRENLAVAIRNYACSSAKPVVGHPFDVTWAANPDPSAFDGMTGIYKYTRQGESAEFYSTNTSKTGVIMHQTVRNLPAGTYDVVVQACSSFTSGRGFSSPITDGGGIDRTYVFANQVSEMVPVRDSGSNLVYEPLTYVLHAVEVNDGTLDIGIRHDAPGANWDILRIHHIARIASASDNTTERFQWTEAMSRACLFASSATLPDAFIQKMLSSQSLHELQDAIEQASAMSVTTRTFLQTRSKAQELADVPYFQEQGNLSRERFEDVLKEADSMLSAATTIEAVAELNAMLLREMYDYVANVSPAEGQQFDVTYLMSCPDLTPYLSGTVIKSWLTEQATGTIRTYSDASVISDGGLQTFYEYACSSATTESSFAVCQDVHLPAGTYRATSLAFADTGQRTVRPIVTMRANRKDGTAVINSTLSAAHVQFELNEEQDVRLGLYAYAGNQAKRMGIGYLHLYKMPSHAATAIVEISDEADMGNDIDYSDCPIFNLQGQKIADRLDRLQDGYQGIIIVKGRKIMYNRKNNLHNY